MIFKKDFLVFQLLLLADKNVFSWNLELIFASFIMRA